MMEAQAWRRPRILMLAWLCAPDRGSEWAAGWGMVVAAARIADVTVLAEQDSADAMQAWCRRHPETSPGGAAP